MTLKINVLAVGIILNIRSEKTDKTMKLVKYNPLNEFIPSTFGSMLENALNNGSNSGFEPLVDFIKNEDNYEIHLIAPGMEKNDFQLEINNDILSISGERKLGENTNYTQIESHFGSFKRTFKLGEGIDTSKINASYVNGVLKVELPLDKKKLEKKTIQVS